MAAPPGFLPALPQVADDGAPIRSSTPPERLVCDVCGKTIDGEPAGRGLLMWSRGDELRIEEPPLCEECSSAIQHAAGVRWDHSDDED